MIDKNPSQSAEVGRHVLADLRGISPALLRNEGLLMSTLINGLARAGFQILDQRSHKFPGAQSGVTGIVLLSESHAAFHSYPEYGYLALDVFSCGAPNPLDVVNYIIEQFQPDHHEINTQARGRGLREETPARPR